MTEKNMEETKMGKHFSIVLQNPPYADRSNGGMYLDMQFVEKCNKIADKQIVIHPLNKWISNTKIGKINAESGHLKEIDIIDANKEFKINTDWIYAGIYVYDNINTYDEYIVTDLYNEKHNIEISERFDFFELIKFKPYFISLIKKYKKLKNDLTDKYQTMVNDGHGFIYEENSLQRGKKRYNVTKKDQISLSRVKAYLKEGKYKYCLYKGSFNNSYDQVQEWLNEDPDKLFRGQVCWLTNSKTVKNNIKYWLECPLTDLWRRYKFLKTSAHCAYGYIPALDFEMNEKDFKEYVDSLNKFTRDEIKILKEHNIHNADKL